MKKERWRLYAKKADFAAISKAYGINQVTARIMRNRGVETKEEIESYLKGDLDYLSDPALMKDADKAASLLEAAIANNELIAISSDFDNDGIFSGLLLKEAIIELGGRAAIFTPNRVMEGYGVNSRIVEEANANGASVLLTCDNGIAAFEAIDEAKKLGMTVIVTDHHEVPFEEHDGKKIYLFLIQIAHEQVLPPGFGKLAAEQIKVDGADVETRRRGYGVWLLRLNLHIIVNDGVNLHH